MDDLRAQSPAQIIEQQKKNCIFCKIISHEIPSTEIYSDDKVAVILDINPANEGHSIILPKEHYQILPQIPDKMISYLFVVAKRTSKLLLKSLGVKSTTVYVANGAIAGQKAPHFMIHVIPRKTGDLMFQLPKSQQDSARLDEIQAKLVSGMQALIGKKLNKADAKTEPVKIEQKSDEEHKEENRKEKSEDKQKELDLDDIAKLFG